MYGPTGSMGILRTPEQQFVDVLMQLKRAKLAENAEDAHRFYRNRLQLHVVMTNIEPVLYRRLTVPAGITLQVGGECYAASGGPTHIVPPNPRPDSRFHS